MSFGKNNNIILVDDDILTRTTLKKAIKTYDGLSVLADFDNAEDCLEFLKHNSADLVILDVGLPGMSGIEASKIIKKYYQNVKIMIFTSNTNDQEIISSLFAAADAYYLKAFKTEKQLDQLINNVLAGLGGIDPLIHNSLFNYIKLLPNDKYSQFAESLTDKENQFISLVTHGFPQRDIAKSLEASESNLYLYIFSILSKLLEVDKADNIKQEFKYDLY